LGPPNPRVQRTRPYASLRGSPLTRHPLGRAMRGRSLDDSRELTAGCASGDQGAQEQIKGDGGISSFHLRHARLAGANEFGKTCLGEVSSLAALAQTSGEGKPELDQLGFLPGQSKKLSGGTNLPTGSFEFPPLRALHRSPHVFVVMPHPTSAVLNHGVGRCRGLFVEDLQNQDDIGIDPIDDSPGVVAIPNPELVATGADGWHGPRLRKRELLALLNSSQEISGFNSSTRGERRSLDLAS